MTDKTASAGRSPRVSVVITAYNDLRFLSEAVASVLAQDFADFELIVVDDGNEDKGAFVSLEALDQRIRLLVNATNVGTATAANRAIAQARGEIVVRLDADDVSEPARIGRLVAALDADPELGLVGSAVTLMDEAGNAHGIERMPESDVEIRWTMLFRNPFYHSSVAFRRSLFEEVGGYLAHELISQDYYLWAALMQRCRARNLREPLARYRINPRGLVAQNANTDWRGRTHTIREQLWSEIGLRYDLYSDTPAFDINRLQRGLDISPEGRAAASGKMQSVFDVFAAAARRFQRPGDDADMERLATVLEAYNSGEPPPPPKPNPCPEYAHWFEGKVLSTDWSSIHFINWAKLFSARRDEPLRILEIGSWEGRSAIFFMRFFPNATITCVDTFAGSVEHQVRENWAEAVPLTEQRFDANLAEFGARVEKIRSDSASALQVLASEGRQFDLIYVDGSHKCDDARADAFGAWPLLNDGGIVIFDDYEWTFFDDPALLPKRGIDEFIAAHVGEYDEVFRGYQLIIRRTGANVSQPRHNIYYDEAAMRDAVSDGRHREAIGGLWDEMGILQLDFLRAQGLRSYHYLLDLGCGSGRLAVRAVDYLLRNSYFGIEISAALVEAARTELSKAGLAVKISDATFHVADDFRPSSAMPEFDFIIAQSLFTHLPLEFLGKALDAVRPKRFGRRVRFFATFFIAERGIPEFKHTPGDIVSYIDRDPFHFSIDEITETARAAGWRANWIGEWNHPRDQQMCEFTLPDR